VENLHNGRPIAKLLLIRPLLLAPGRPVDLVELMPPKDVSPARLGLEHVGFVLGDRLAGFVEAATDRLTGPAGPGAVLPAGLCALPERSAGQVLRPLSLKDVLELEGHTFLARPSR
jgi:hypothetical protein